MAVAHLSKILLASNKGFIITGTASATAALNIFARITKKTIVTMDKQAVVIINDFLLTSVKKI